MDPTSSPSSSVTAGNGKKKRKKVSIDCVWRVLLVLAGCLCFNQRGAAAEKNKHYHVATLCKTHFLQQMYRKIDGAVLRSQNERNLDCVITLQTETILQRFMLRFEQLQLDCNDHLFIYDGAHAIGNYKADLSCRHTRQSVGTIYTRTNFVTLKYVTDSWGADTNGFHLVVTAFKDKTDLMCRDFRCAQKDFCISMDLLCDGVNHCGDNTDETTTSLCADQEFHQKILGLNLPVFAAVAGSAGVVALCALSALVVVCCCRRRRHSTPPTPANNSAVVSAPDAASNGRRADDGKAPIAGSAATTANNRAPIKCGYMTLPLKSSAASGNRRPPAIDQGHYRRPAATAATMATLLLARTFIRSSLARCRGTTTSSSSSSTTVISSNCSWCLAK